jgi:hypothetical protein
MSVATSAMAKTTALTRAHRQTTNRIGTATAGGVVVVVVFFFLSGSRDRHDWQRRRHLLLVLGHRRQRSSSLVVGHGHRTLLSFTCSREDTFKGMGQNGMNMHGRKRDEHDDGHGLTGG